MVFSDVVVDSFDDEDDDDAVGVVHFRYYSRLVVSPT
jgi:hypothetical protein